MSSSTTRIVKKKHCGNCSNLLTTPGEFRIDLLIEVFTATSCAKCHAILAMANRVAADLGTQVRLVNVVDEIDYAVKVGVLKTPSVAIGGELEFDEPPSELQLRQALARRASAKR